MVGVLPIDAHDPRRTFRSMRSLPHPRPSKMPPAPIWAGNFGSQAPDKVLHLSSCGFP